MSNTSGDVHGLPAGQAMKRPRRVAVVLLALVVAIFGIWMLVRFAKSAKRGTAAHAVQSAITNPLSFAKSHVTGGIGAILLADPATGLPRIQGVVAGSPAQKAGLRNGDLILEVDGVPTVGRTLAQDVESIRGIAIGSVALTIRRPGSTNLNCVIHRSSWSGLGIQQ